MAAPILALILALTWLPSDAWAAEGLSPRAPWTSNRFAGSPLPPAPYTVERIHPHVAFREATDLAFAPGSRVLFVSEQNGKLFAFDTSQAGEAPRLVLDLRAVRKNVDNVLGFTFHPSFATNRFLYVNYNGPGNEADSARVSRFTVTSLAPPTIDPATEQVVIRWPGGGHNGCTLAFGPDGLLYISTGDGADPDPPDGRFKTGQNLGDLLASILRIDVDVPDEATPYRVPQDNPFVHLAGARPEVWAFGFRNPFRMSFGPDGSLWATDVGWEQWEMVYRVARGGNYGWPITEGPNLRVRDDLPAGPGPILPPIHAVPHTDGASITGGQVSRASRLPGLRGAYLYGDWETGRFWALRHDGDRLVSNLELCDTSLKPVSFAVDAEGDVLVLDFNSGLYRFATNTAPEANHAFPRKLGDSGLAASLAPLTPAPGVVSYRIRAPMWNDHAQALWWVGVPDDTRIATRGGVGNIAGGTWYFPSNTVLARTLTLERSANDPASRRPVETQILHWDGQSWNPYTYRWNPAGTDADLVEPAGEQAVFDVTDPQAPGGVRRTPWRFQSRGECLRCHNAWAGETLTLNPLQLGPVPSRRERRRAQDAPPPDTSPDTGISEFERLTRLGVVRGDASTDRNTPRLVDPYDTSLALGDRARSWLHVNCSACHRFGAGGAAAVRFNLEENLDLMRLVDVVPTRGNYDLLDARLVAPGDPWRSVLLYRVATEGTGRMPHVGSRLVDERGLALLRDWVRSLAVPDNPPPPKPPASETPRERQDRIRRALAEGVDNTGAPTWTAEVNGVLAAVLEPGRERRLPALASAALTHTNALVRDLLQRYLAPDQRRETLGIDIRPETILSRSGDAGRGRILFAEAAQCVRCHARDGTGRAFGPDLKGLARKYSRPQLLDQILHPSAIVAPEFRSVTVTLRDDSEVIGFVVRRDPTTLVIREESLAERTVPSSEVRELRESTLSAMPEGLLAPLTAQEAADLLAYLAND